MEFRNRAVELADKGGDLYFQHRGPVGVLQLLSNHSAQPPWENVCQGVGEQTNRFSNLKRNHADSVMVTEQRTSWLYPRRQSRDHRNLLFQSTHIL